MKFDFLISSERSGSNLLTKLIDSHSHYSGPSPIHFLRTFSPVLKNYGDLMQDQNWQVFTTDLHDFFNCKIGIWKSQFKQEEFTQIVPRSLEGVITYIYEKEAGANQKTRSFIKEIGTYNYFDFISTHFNDAKFIWLVRDPRDVALSWSKSPVHRGDIVRGSNIWKRDQAATIALQQKYPDKVLLVKYEELIANQKETLEDICDFLEITFEEAMIDFHQSKSSTQNAQQTDNWKNLSKKIMDNNARKFLKGLSKKQIEFIEYNCSSEMEHIGYPFEYQLIDQDAFKLYSHELTKLERHEKEEYNLIDEQEKAKRNQWYKKFLEIQAR